MRYAHLFWRLFGLPVTGWDPLQLEDLRWMKTAADDFEKKQEAAHG